MQCGPVLGLFSPFRSYPIVFSCLFQSVLVVSGTLGVTRIELDFIETTLGHLVRLVSLVRSCFVVIFVKFPYSHPGRRGRLNRSKTIRVTRNYSLRLPKETSLK